MESCSRNDEGWIYCRGNQTIDADKALEKRIYVLKRIMRALKEHEERRKACGGKHYTGLDESIYYDSCGNIMSADEVFEQNGWVKGTESLFVSSYDGINRLGDTVDEYYPMNIAIRSVRERRLSVNPLILKENAEAVYLLTRAWEPHEFLSEAAEIILSSILDDISGQRKELLVALLVGKGFIKEQKIVKEFNKDIRGGIETAFIDQSIRFVPKMISNRVIRSVIVATIVHNMVNLIAINNPFFLRIRKRAGIIKGANIAVLLLTNYGVIEKLSKSARRLKINYPKVYQKLDEAKLTLAYHFFEDIFDESLQLFEITSANNATDQAFVQAISKLLNNYSV
ncbi:hypothetical protein KKI90_15765 [Xenorhabdus bovienii]|uniref:Uncharacterized protein n=1 Tax=Xenorhabdus bovienii TaxID=40576 RepID=A0AAJ1JBD1_XENBV|nr:hypothetical protein [Xenorhabdus bovienii]MDE1479632.1 hypothetical protein [Xenorhabdus bovienii]MDE1487756.1 hypothetical protein [Xenorhabdus bovienii]MDE1492009.1 hypothetical protein [Xenorhabdus bovienii]MDE1496207.1 hypothetical protein [Xenorhabdus bovienii]MDE9474215.1 hypothetical protein [Xenorhabdus bovienii]